jgi:hypothetical protein
MCPTRQPWRGILGLDHGLAVETVGASASLRAIWGRIASRSLEHHLQELCAANIGAMLALRRRLDG